MVAELPKVSRLADHLSRLPGAVHGVGRVCAIRLKVGDNLVDFDGLKARDRNVEILIDEELGELRQLNGKTFPIPTRILGDLVVGQEQRAFPSLAQAFEYDHWYLAKTANFRSSKATVSRD